MALIGNYSVLNKTCGRFTNGTSTAGAYAANTRANWNSNQFGRAMALQDPTEPIPIDTESFSHPQGYNLTEALIPALKATKIDMASTNQVTGLGTVTGTAIRARLSNANLTGLGTIASGALVSLAKVNCNLTGSGAIAGSLGIVSNLNSSLSGSGSLTANLKSIIKISSNLAGTSSISPDMRVKWSMQANITVGQVTGNWQEIIDGGYTAGEVMKILLSVAAGKTQVSGSTVKFRDPDDTKDRVTATVSSGARSSVTIDAS